MSAISFYIYSGLLVLCAILQSTVTSHIRLAGASPDLVLLLVVALALQGGSGELPLYGILGGVMLDALSGAPFGISTIVLGLVSYLVRVGETNVFHTVRFRPYVAISLATPVYHLLIALLLGMTGHRIVWGAMIWHVALPAMLVNLLFMTLIYYFVLALNRLLQPKRFEWQ